LVREPALLDPVHPDNKFSSEGFARCGSRANEIRNPIPSASTTWSHIHPRDARARRDLHDKIPDPWRDWLMGLPGAGKTMLASALAPQYRRIQCGRRPLLKAPSDIYISALTIKPMLLS
jgi:hypothetical protein